MSKILRKPRCIYFLLVIMLLPFFLSTKNVEGQETLETLARTELTLTLEQPTAIEPETDITELKFTVDYNMTAIFIFSQENNVNIREGLLGYTFNCEPTDVWAKDNLGNVFSPIINNSKIVTPKIGNITVQPNLEYSITLHFKITEPKFDSEIKQFALIYGLECVPVPTSVFFKLPKDYQVFQETTNDVFTDEQHTILNWNFINGERVSCTVVFLPFSIQRVVKSMQIFADVQSFDASSSLIEKINMTYELPGEVMIWKTDIFIDVKIPFPKTNSTFDVLSVSDGIGNCKKITSLPSNGTTKSLLGHYFKDDDNEIIWIFPRFSYNDAFSQLDIEITLQVPNTSAGSGTYEIPYFEPYQGQAGMIFSFQESETWRVNLTDSFKVQFLLPEGTKFIKSIPNEEVLKTTENNRQIISFTYNSPIEIPHKEWVVVFNSDVLKQFTNDMIITLILFTIPAFVLVITYKYRNKNEKLLLLEIFPLSIITYRVISDVTKFVNFSISHPLFSHLIFLEIILLAAIMVISVIVLIKKQKGKKANNNQSENTNKNQKNPFVRIY